MTAPLPDAGVFDLTTRTWMVRVAEKPQPGQYTFDSERGYAFAPADEGHARYFGNDPVPPMRSMEVPTVGPLTAEKIAELRAWHARDDYSYPDGDAIMRLLDEVEGWRTRATTVETWRGSQDFSNPTWTKQGATVQIANWLERARALLRRIEWGGGYQGGGCPVCNQLAYEGHLPGCELAALLGGVS